ATVASRLTRLANRLTEDGEDEVQTVAGRSIHEMAEALVLAVDEDKVLEATRKEIGQNRDPTEAEIADVKERLVQDALEPLQKATVREKLLSLQSQTEQVIDIATQDRLVSAGWVDDEAKSLTETFEEWIKEHHDEYVALRAYFERPYDQRPTLSDIKEL